MSSHVHNVDRNNSSSVVIESEDDDPGIRGFSSSNNTKSSSSTPSLNHKQHHQYHPLELRPPIDPQNHVKLTADPLDAAIIEQSYPSPGSAALKLDQFVLGRTEMVPEVAQGSLSRSGSALNHLKGVATHSRSHCIPTPKQVETPASPGALTWASSSPSSESSVESGYESNTQSNSYQSDEFYSLSIKRMIKQICVAGLESRSKHNRKFCLNLDEIRDICRYSREVFLSEPSMLRLDAPIKVVGDIHGQFRDLMRLFKKGGMPPTYQYLFLGDYVDRGKQSLETVMLLLLLKLRYPSQVHLLRGNHECAGVTKVYGFYDECKRRSSVKAWRTIVDVFNTLPIAALVGERIFCVHGGISPSLSSFSQIEAVRRPTDVPDTGLVADLLWSDPDSQVKEWSENDRGVSFCFGQRSLERFCRQLNVDLVVRGHMVVEDGYEFFAGRRLVTVFSAPDYCGDFDNYGAMMSISKDLVCSFDVIEPRCPRKATLLKQQSAEVFNSAPKSGSSYLSKDTVST